MASKRPQGLNKTPGPQKDPGASKRPRGLKKTQRASTKTPGPQQDPMASKRPQGLNKTPGPQKDPGASKRPRGLKKTPGPQKDHLVYRWTCGLGVRTTSVRRQVEPAPCKNTAWRWLRPGMMFCLQDRRYRLRVPTQTCICLLRILCMPQVAQTAFHGRWNA